MKFNYIITLIGTTILTACASTAPPLPAPSALFQGQASMKSIEGGTSSKPSGQFQKNEVFAEREII